MREQVVLMVDISGRVTRYDEALSNAISKSLGGDFKYFFCSPDKISLSGHGRFIRLLNLIPSKYKSSSNFVKRSVKVIEILLNYVLLIYFIKRLRISILHMQWLPLLDFCGWEYLFLKFARFLFPDIQIILTLHNIYPHDISESRKNAYLQRLKKLSHYINRYIVHTKSTKIIVCKEFGLSESNVSVIHHGVFEPQGIDNIKRSRKDEKVRFISYGIQSKYKGTDILVEAASMLPNEYKNRMELSIVGSIRMDFYDELMSKADGIKINWKPYFVDELILYQEIIDSDVIVLPYRAISQSGVLLLALCFNKPIITSDIPSFRETLEDCSEDTFFRSEKPEDLCRLMKKYIDGSVNMGEITNHIASLRKKYSWEAAAVETYKVYFI